MTNGGAGEREHGRLFAALPSVDRLLRDERLQWAIDEYGREIVVDRLRALLAEQRAALKAATGSAATSAEIVEALVARLDVEHRPSVKRLFNLTGTVLHTNLGRALLPDEAIEAATLVLREPCNLEYELDAGKRGDRDAHVETLLRRLSGAQGAVLANNNAGAVMLALNSLARGKEVIVSRGELVEIGGSFRMPEIIEGAGCTLREVGTTNRTYVHDFERAIGPGTGAILKVHASNYAIVGFSTAPGEAELARVAHRQGLPFITDLGSGSLIELQRFGLPTEPTPMRSLAAGADLVTFSGDKLLGGPQVGIAVGRQSYLDLLKRNPLKRALRLDKGRIAALEAVLRLYLNPDCLVERLPTLRALTRPVEEIAALAYRLIQPLQTFCGSLAQACVASCASQVGSGSLPLARLESVALRITPTGEHRGAPTADIARALRALPIPVIGRVHDGAVWLDLRCLEDEEDFCIQLRDLTLRWLISQGRETSPVGRPDFKPEERRTTSLASSTPASSALAPSFKTEGIAR